VLILATLYVCYFSHLGAIGFTGPDEPRYAWIARDMAETGDWVTPRLYGKPWFEKPVLYYWGAAVSFRLLGVSEAAARLPGAISALLATLSLAWLALRLYDRETARWLLLLLPTSIGMIGFSHAAAPDMPFTAMLTIAMVSIAFVLDLTGKEDIPTRPRTPRLALFLLGFFLGLAVLAKGPAAILLSGGAVFLWALFTRRWLDAFRCLHPVAMASFCLTALPWYILCARRNPDFVRVFFLEHNFKRYLTPEFQHVQPFWYYGPILFLGLFPWIGLTLGAVINAFRRRLGMQLNAVTLYLLTWAAFPVLFFSISQSKLPGYVLPAIPALVLLAACALAALLRLERVPIPVGFSAFALPPVAAVAAVGFYGYFESLGKASTIRWYGFLCVALSLIAVAGMLRFRVSKRHQATVASGALTWVCFVILTNRAALPWLDSKVSARPIARNVVDKPEVMNEVMALRLRRGWQYGLNFYLHRELREWNSSETRQRYVISSPAGVAELEKHRIPYQLVDDTCLEAMLIRIAQPPTQTTKGNLAGSPRSTSFEKGKRENLGDNHPRSRQLQ
jgi:4-amino-4-deoxy-L-arabinose transferase-like glycosyltransferase